MNRRDFLKTGLVFTGGLALGAAAKAALPERKDAFFPRRQNVEQRRLDGFSAGIRVHGLDL